MLPITELARIAELARATSDTELAHKIVQLAELARASSGFLKMVQGGTMQEQARGSVPNM